MQKEPIIAIIIGSLVGLGVAFAVWQYSRTPQNIINDRSSRLSNNVDQSNASNEISATAENISIFSPNDYAAFSESTVEISGITDGNAIIIVQVNDSEFISKSNPQGEFVLEIELDSGINNVQINSLAIDKFKTLNLTLVYSSQISSDLPLTAIIGSVNDISENAIQVTTMDDIIEQISITEDATFANIIDDPEEIEFSDIAIGDFVVGIGTKDSNIYQIERLLVAESVTESDKKLVYGELVELSASEFLVNNSIDNTQYSIDATGKINVTKFDENQEVVRARLSESTEGEMILIIGQMDEELTASSIHIFPTSE